MREAPEHPRVGAARKAYRSRCFWMQRDTIAVGCRMFDVLGNLTMLTEVDVSGCRETQ